MSVLATYDTAAAAWPLWTGASEEFSWPGLIVALATIPTMRWLAHRKIAIAGEMASQASELMPWKQWRLAGALGGLTVLAR